MKKRLLASLLALVMLLGLLPTAAFAAGEEDPGVQFTKSAKQNADGSVTITMEAYATGETVTTTKTTPMDVVLVLDQSGSMAYDFSGNSTSSNTSRRQYAMKAAVNSFIDKVAENAQANDVEHRIGIVTFNNNASARQGMTNDSTVLHNSVNGLPASPSGATNVAAGITVADTMLSYASREDAAKVVIVFTDGVPTTNSDFSTTVATNAIITAKGMKDDGVTIYTIGIFTGADPNQLYGETGFSQNSDGRVGSNWSTTLFSDADCDVPAGNRFLNYLSSNFKGATEIGIKDYSGWIGYYKYTGWEITKNFDRTASGYYLTASDSKSLNGVFTTISDSINTANQEINESTVVQDVVSPYFEVPENTSAIKAYTADKTADGWGDRTEATDVAVTINGQTVSVTGYDFAEHAVDETAGTGQKLIIEFTVAPNKAEIANAATFPVPTNTSAGMYLDGEAIITAEGGEATFYGVQYDANEGTGTVPESVVQATAEIQVASAEDYKDTLTKEGAVLLGFSTKQNTLIESQEAENAAGVITSYTPSAAGMTTLYAVWAADENGDGIPDYQNDKFTVTYNANGGSGSVTDETQYLSGATVTVQSGDALEKNGCTFTGWNTAADGTGTSYAAGNEFTIEADTTLYAQWEENEPSESQTVYVYVQIVGDDGQPLDSYENMNTNKAGYFTIGKIQVSGLPAADDGSNGNATNVYEAYKDNVDAGMDSMERYAPNQDLDISNVTWTTLKNCISGANDYVENEDTWHLDGQIKLSALTVINIVYTDGVDGEVFEDVTYQAIAGASTPSFNKDNPDAVPQRDGYTFDGWTPEVAQTVVAPETGDTITYTATWKQNTVTVTYNANGGAWTDAVTGYTMAEDNETASIEVEPYTTTSIIGVNPEKANATFTGWYLSSDCKEEEKVASLIYVTKNVTLYAGWKEDGTQPSDSVDYSIHQHFIGLDGEGTIDLNGLRAPAGSSIAGLIEDKAKDQEYTDGQTYTYFAEETTVNEAKLEDGAALSANDRIDLYYYLDNWDDENDEPTGGDGIPDCYQALIEYKAVGNGSTEPEYQVVTLEQDGEYVNTDTVTVMSGAVAGENAEFVGWETPDEETVKTATLYEKLTVEGGQTYTYTAYFQNIIPEPDKPSDEDVINAFYGTITVHCTANEDHEDKVFDELLPGSFQVGEVVDGEVLVTVFADEYVEQYLDKHSIDDDGKETFTLVKVGGEWLMNKANLTFEVKCEEEIEPPVTDEFTVTFEPGAHGTLSGTKTYTVEDGEKVPGVPTVNEDDGYVFTGWEGSDGKTYSSGEIENLTITGNMTFTAQYTKITADTYKVTFNEGSHGTLSGRTTYTVEDGEKVPDVPTVNEDNGYDFIGWRGSDGKTYSSSEIKNLKITGDMTFTALYQQNDDDDGDDDPTTYSVRYHANYGKDATRTYNYEEGDKVVVKDYMLTGRDGYVFDGWNTKANGKGTNYDPDDVLTKSIKSSYDLYAVWVRDVSDPDDTGVSGLLNTDDHIQYLYGYPDNTFGPTRNMTRAEAAQMFFNLLRSQSVRKTVSFSDVDGTEWFADAVHTMASLGVLKGYPDGTFQPNKPITRAEFTTMAMQFTDLDQSGNNAFSDVSLGDWFYTFVVGASKYGWISGYPDGTFKPNANITRAEVTSIVNNMLGRYADEDYVDDHPGRINSFIDLSDTYWAYYPIMEATNEHDYSKGYQSEDWSNVTWAARR